MTWYTIEGYLSALQMREKRTLLVEGPDDNVFVNRLVGQLDCTSRVDARRLVIDSTNVIRPGLPPLGAREVVETVHSRAGQLRQKFAGLVDREFRGLQLSPIVAGQQIQDVVIDQSLFWTRGHSVENYLLTPNSALVFLQIQFPHLVSAASRQALLTCHPSLIKWSAAVSVAALQTAVIDRSSGLCTPAMWHLEQNGSARFDATKLSEGLQARGVDAAALPLFLQVAAEAHLALTDPGCADLSRWLAHGHLATEMTWSGIGLLFETLGSQAQETQQIASGYKGLKLRTAIDRWIVEQVPPPPSNIGSEAPRALIDWLNVPFAA